MSLNQARVFTVAAFVCENCAWISLHAPGILIPAQKREVG
jgi:hypothetical protein